MIIWNWKHQIIINKMGPKLIKPVILCTPIDVKTWAICRIYTKIKCLYNFLRANLWHRWSKQNNQTGRSINRLLSHFPCKLKVWVTIYFFSISPSWTTSLNTIYFKSSQKSFYLFNHFLLICYFSLKSISIPYGHFSKIINKLLLEEK